MDRQTINIPVNTRVVGDAGNISEGIYVLYLEDYVHTFIKKLIYEQENGAAADAAVAGTAITIYGSSFERASQKIMVVSGAADSECADGNYFPSSVPLGTALAGLNKDRGIRLELTVNNTTVILDDFYIYYDQNEERQNYLIDWNNKRHDRNGQDFLQKPAGRIRNDNAVKLGKIAQAYNKESARVSMVWGVMNILSLGLVVCILAYGVISLNSYTKMQSMQESIDYCMALVTENIENSGGRITEKHEETQTAASAVPTESSMETSTEISADMPIEASVETFAETPAQISAEQSADSAAQTLPQETQARISDQSTSEPQYYVVQRGDTLRGICISIYGDYSRIDEICVLNGLEDPDSILYGQKLLLP